jgi:hypothetical protein
MDYESEVPSVLHIYRTERMYPTLKNTVRLDTWCVFFEVGGKLTYWLMDNTKKEEKVDDPIDVWRRFVREWTAPEYNRYKREVVLRRNMDTAHEKLEGLMQSE